MGGGAAGILVGGGPVSSSDDGYQISKSLRFNPGDGPYLKKMVQQTGNRRRWTTSFWIKNSEITAEYPTIFSSSGAGNTNNHMIIRLEYPGGELKVDERTSSSSSYSIATTNKHRDYSAWYHFVVQFDSSQADSDERVVIFKNGVRQVLSGSYPAQHYESHWFEPTSYVTNHIIGREAARSDYETSAYLADIYLIDGLAISPSAFGEFSTTYAWNPKSFSVPAPNNARTWSSGATNLTNPANAFDGDTSSGGTKASSGASQVSITFDPALTGVSEFEVNYHNGGSHVVAFNGNELVEDAGGGGDNWRQLPSGMKIPTTINSFQARYGPADTNASIELAGIRVNGVVLIDGHTDPTTRNNPNNGTTWSSDLTVSSGSITNAANAFNGNDTEYAEGGSNGTTLAWTPSSPITFTKLEALQNQAQGNTEIRWQSNADDSWSGWQIDIGRWQTLSSSGGVLKAIETRRTDGGKPQLWGVKIDDHILIDRCIDNSAHLNFSDASRVSSLGYDSFKGTIAAATGGLPIYNTTDDYGDTKGSGYRADSSAGTTDGTGLVFAWPGDTTTGEVHASINTGSSAKTVTANGDPSVDTDNSRLYGSSVAFDRTGDYLDVDGGTDFNFGTGDYCIECWFMTTDNSVNEGIFVLSDTSGGLATDESAHISAMVDSNGMNVRPGDGTTSTLFGSTRPANDTWHHLALTRASGTFRAFYDGALLYTKTNVTTSHADQYLAIGGYYDTSYLWKGNIQDFRVYKGVAKYTASFTSPARNDFTVNNLDHARRYETATGKFVLFNNSTGNLTDDKVDNVTVTNNSSVTTASAPSNPHGISTMASFSGSNYLSTNFANPIGNGSAATLDVWWDHSEANTQSTGTERALISNGNGGYIQINGNNSGGQTNIYLYGSTSVDLGAFEWGHFRVTWDGTTTTAYWNGVQKYQGTATCSADNIILGANEAGNAKWEGRLGPVIFTEGNLGAPPAGGLKTIDGEFTVTDSDTIDLTLNDVSDIDSLTDTPTNYGTDTGLGGEVRGNYCTFNPLSVDSNIALSQGNLKATISANSKIAKGTMSVQNAGKWYFEVECLSDTADNNKLIGVHFLDGGSVNESYVGENYSVGYHKDGRTLYAGGQAGSTGSTWGPGDTIGVALDLSGGASNNGKVTFYKNGTAQSNGIVTTLDCTRPWTVAVNRSGSGSGTTVFSLNSGQRSFKYAAPTDHKCLCSHNLSDIFGANDNELEDKNDPSKYFDILDYKGTGASRTFSSLGFGPDMIWTKQRSSTGEPRIQDVVRGTNSQIRSNTSAAQLTETNNVTAFNSDGYTIGANGDINSSSHTHVAWLWDAGTTNSGANNDGTVNVSSGSQWVNNTCGFSITKYTGDNASGGATVGHGLTAKPEMVIIKRLDDAQNCIVWVNGLTSNKNLYLHETDGESDPAGGYIDDGDTNDSVVKLVGNPGGNGNMNYSTDYIMYCWAPIVGYSAFGTYTGNGSTDGPFIHTGFSPKFVMFKRKDSAGGWVFLDTVRDQTNPTNIALYINEDSAEASYDFIDAVSNGFKHRQTGTYHNSSNATHVWAAFAEHPFKTTRAR